MLTLKQLTERHTEELSQRSDTGKDLVGWITGEELTERERAIFEIGYGNGYSDSLQDEENGETIQVLK